MRKLKFYLVLSSALILSILVGILSALPALAAVGTITISPTSGPVGSTVTISGTGFTAATTYTVHFDGTTVATGTIAAGGVLPATLFTVPAAVAGAHNVTVTTTSDTSNTRTFTITPAVSLSSTIVTPGITILVTGSGFGASRSVTVYVDSTARVTTSTNATGTFSTGLTIPTGAGGTHTVTATDTALNSASTAYTIVPTITLSTASVTVGTQITITGSNFAANTSVRIYVDSALITTVATNSSGSCTANITVPAGTFGTHTVSATDLLGNSDSETYSIVPSITANTTAITSGSQVIITGNGFASLSTVNFYLDNSLLSGDSVSTNSAGSFTKNISIPLITGGNHILEARDNSFHSATLSFTLTQGITLNPQSGSTGTNVQISGKGFVANRTVSIKLDGVPIATAPTSPATNAGGEFVASFNIPAIFGGVHAIEASDGTFTFSSSLTVNSNASISVVRGPVGTNVLVSGTSFGSGVTVLVTLDDESVATVNADINGSFSTSFTVPPTTGGNHTIRISDRTRRVDFNFAVTSTVEMTPTSGFVGTAITLTGTGFAAQRPLAIKYDAVTIPTTVQTDTKGRFTVVFNAPVSKGGNHTVVVSDATNSVTNTFVMDSTAPAVPTLISPVDKNGGKTPEFEWNAVNDASGVTYILQVSKSASFNTLVMEKKGLTDPVYQVTEGEMLEPASKNEPYYWRVKAIDGALNESNYSQVAELYVGFILADWGLYVIFGVAIIIAFVVGFLLRGGGRKARPSAPAPTPPPEES